MSHEYMKDGVEHVMGWRTDEPRPFARCACGSEHPIAKEVLYSCPKCGLVTVEETLHLICTHEDWTLACSISRTPIKAAQAIFTIRMESHLAGQEQGRSDALREVLKKENAK